MHPNEDFHDLCARGGMDLAYLGCAQIDGEGRTNVSAIGSCSVLSIKENLHIQWPVL